MKINDDYLRGLLEAFEAAEGIFTDIEELKSRGYSYEEDIFAFHLQFLNDEGLVKSEIGPGFGMDTASDGAVMWSVIPLRLTANAHRFLRRLRKEHGLSANDIEKGKKIQGDKMAELSGEGVVANKVSSQSGIIEKDSKWDFFISHAKEDADEIAIPLLNALKERGFSVWFDDEVLTVGDSIRRSIENGLSKCRFGIVILSPAFKQKEWPQRELDGLFTREISGGKVILPVWHNLEKDEVSEYWPMLADKVAIRSFGKNPGEIAEAIIKGARVNVSASDHSIPRTAVGTLEGHGSVPREAGLRFTSAFSEAEAILDKGKPDAFDFMAKHAIYHDAAAMEVRRYFGQAEIDRFDALHKTFSECRNRLKPGITYALQREVTGKDFCEFDRENMLKAVRELIRFVFDSLSR